MVLVLIWLEIQNVSLHRLTSERGLPALRHVFDKTKFKGKGHEVRNA
jgi:TIMELESS-interacting protein